MAEGRAGMSERNVDALLVQRVQAGDKTAFDLLVRKYQSRIGKLISRYIHDHAEVEDVTQEAFIKAYRGLANFRGESAFYTWMYRIAINTAKNYLVASGRKTPDIGIDPQEAEQYEGASLLKEFATPESLAMADEIKKTVFESIEKLPMELKTAITLRELEGLSYEEIAEVMECPIGTVRSRIFRAREAIDASLKPLLNGA
jgi:RNA polymerase sigma-70 factor (ECF subfamily)